MRDWIDEWIEVESRQVGIFSFDVNYIWSVIPRNYRNKLILIEQQVNNSAGM